MSLIELLPVLKDLARILYKEESKLSPHETYYEERRELYNRYLNPISSVRDILIAFFKEASLEERQILWDFFSKESDAMFLIRLIKEEYDFSDENSL